MSIQKSWKKGVEKVKVMISKVCLKCTLKIRRVRPDRRKVGKPEIPKLSWHDPDRKKESKSVKPYISERQISCLS